MVVYVISSSIFHWGEIKIQSEIAIFCILLDCFRDCFSRRCLEVFYNSGQRIQYMPRKQMKGTHLQVQRQVEL